MPTKEEDFKQRFDSILLDMRAGGTRDAENMWLIGSLGARIVDQGQQHYEEQQRQRSIAALRRRAAALGFQVNPVEVAA